MAVDKDLFYRQLAEAGETRVRENIALGVYNQIKQRLALEWLRQRDEERVDGRLSEELRLAREANDIARAANSHADRANRLAGWSIAVAIVAALLALFGFSS